MRLAMLMISFKRGTPSVTFFADTPAKWKVFSVICVAGSPIDCAATVPIISPGFTCDCWKRSSISPASQWNACGVRRYSCRTRLEARVERRSAEKSSVAFFCASMDRGSLPATTRMFWLSRCTVSATSTGLRLVISPGCPAANVFCAFQMSRLRLMGSGHEASPVGITSLHSTSWSAISVANSSSSTWRFSALARRSSAISGPR
mmetsp:Transcript_35160/g.76854  ORF Transcript_35160/g.76854 Transcript_35160/m.76854 type:complete len:204 (+) Transcript_35160:1351-1962(+)